MNVVSPTVKMEQRRTPLQHLSMNESTAASPLKSEDRLYMEASLWVEDRTGVDIIPDARHFAEALQDGELLLRIAESVLPEVAAEMKAVHTKESWYEGWNEVGMAKAVENIHIFLSICRAVGVSEHYHFSASDLIKGREIRRVVECLIFFRRIVSPPATGVQTPATAQELAAEQNHGTSQGRPDYRSPKTVAPSAKSGNAGFQSNTHETFDSVSDKSIWYSALADAYNNVVEMSPSPRKREMFSKDFSTRKLQFSNMPAEVIDVPYQIELAEMMDKANHSGDHSPETARSLLLAQSPSLLQKRFCTTDDVFVVKKFATRLAAKERVVKELVAELSTALQREEALQTKVARLERLGIQATKTNNEEQYRSFPVDNSVASQSCSDRNVIQEPTTQLAENFGKDVGHSSPDGALAREKLTAAESRIKLLNSHNLNTASALKGLRDSLRMLKEEFIQAQTANVQLLNNTGSDLERITRDYIKLKLENRHLRNELQELKGNIRVFCRVRPLMSDSDGPGQGVFCPGEEVVIVEGQKNSSMNFVYDKVYGPSVTQEQVFMDVLPLVRSVMEGYNVCIFAYGQTGSGKTYTMLGPHPSKEGAGVIQRSIDLLFNLKNDAVNDWDYKISAEIIEVYNESVRDLLGVSVTVIQAFSTVEQRRLDNTIRGSDSVQVRVESTLEVLHLMEIGSKNRAVGATSMNEHSSRSHCIVIVRVEGQQRFTGEKIFSSLNLIDLAGSERVSRSEATGDRLKETQHINKSLAALGDVMQALLDKRPHIPFRNSKLTQLLQDSLGGSSKVVMLAHVAPERDSQSETVSTLKFASRLLNVELGSAGKNKGGFRQLQAMVVDKDKEVEDLKRQLDDNQKLAAFKVDNCKKEVASKKAEAKALAARVAVLEQKNKELEQRLEHGSSFESTLSHLQRHSISLNSSVSSDMLRSDMSMKGRTPRYGESGSLSRIPSVCSTTGDASELSSSEVATPRDVDPTADISADVLSSSESDLVSIPHRKAQPQISHQVSRPKDVGASFQQSRKLRIPGILHSSTNGLPVLRTSAVSGGMLPVTRVQKFISKRWM